MMTEPGPNRVLMSIAAALWNVHQGYNVEDASLGGRDPSIVDWHPDNAEDRADRARFMGHAELVLEHLLAAGWRPPDAT